MTSSLPLEAARCPNSLEMSSTTSSVSAPSSVKKFVFTSKHFNNENPEIDDSCKTLVVIIPEILELGAGTALPGIISALCGAQVTLSDSAKLPHCLDQCRKSVEANNLVGRVNIIGLTWGIFLSDAIKLKGQVDLILGSDCFYDPVVFDDLLSTVAFILGNNPGAKFLSTYQERSADWSIESLLTKWELKLKHVPLNEWANSCEIDLLQLMQDHTIHLLEITLR